MPLLSHSLLLRFAILLSVIGSLYSSQSEQQDTAPKTNNQETVNSNPLSQFVPAGFTILDSTYGDLNLDTIPDLILVLKHINEEDMADTTENLSRPLLLLTGTEDGSFQLAAKNDNSVLCVNCGGVFGDPYEGITIKNGYFSVEHFGGSSWKWTRIVTYKYNASENNWFLHRDGGSNFHSSAPEESTNYMKTKADFGTVKFEEYNIYNLWE